MTGPMHLLGAQSAIDVDLLPPNPGLIMNAGAALSSRFVGCHCLLAALLLLGFESTRASAAPSDAVAELRQALNVTNLELISRNPEIDKAKPEERPKLIEQARTKLLTERIQALRSIGEMRQALMLQQWTQVTAGDEQQGSYRAALTLLTNRFRDAVRRGLNQGNKVTRLAILHMLAETAAGLRTPEDRAGVARSFTQDVIKLLQPDQPPEIRHTSARTLGLIFPEPEAASAALLKLLESPNLPDREAAADGMLSLIRTVTQPPSAASDRPTNKVEADRADIVTVGKFILPVAARGFKNDQVRVRRAAAEAFELTAGALDSQMPQPRTSEDTGELGFAAQDVQRARTELQPLVRAFESTSNALTKGSQDADLAVRLRSRHALENVASARARLQRALNQIQPEAGNQQDGLLRGLQEALPALEAGIGDPESSARVAAIDVLEQLGPAAAPAVPALIRALEDQNLFVRWSASRTLSKVGPKNAAPAVPALARLLEDPDYDVCLATAVTLERLGPLSAGALPELRRVILSGDEDLRVATIRTVEAIGPEAKSAIPTLITALLKDPEFRVRQLAADAIGKFGPTASEAIPALQQALKDENSSVRRSASEALIQVAVDSGGR